MSNEILRLDHITKKYMSVMALDDVSLGFEKGEVHAIAGENGAGKSTFIKVITGAIQPTAGTITFNGQTFRGMTPEKSSELGISVIYQEFNLFPSLSVAENLFFGRYPLKHGTVDYRRMCDETNTVMRSLGIDIKASTLVKNLSVGYQQLVEIAKAVSRNSKIMIMDEPSAPLTDNEVHHLFEIVEHLKAKGVTIIYISHRMEEIFKICDRVSVFRDGRFIQTLHVNETNMDELIRIMVNRELGQQFPEKHYHKGEKILEIKNLNTTLLKNISLEAYRGEILGLAGLVGAGRTETARALFGADRIRSGEFYLHGKKLTIRSPKDAIANGIGLIPEDRKKQGVLLNLSIRYNISYANFGEIGGKFGISNALDHKASEKFIRQLSIKTPTEEERVVHLSGGNQQKVALAKWLFKDTEVLIFDEPTRGIDVGAKQEIYQLMNQLVEKGKVIIMISSEMPEMIGMADRVIVMHEGKIMGELQKKEISQERILTLASGIADSKAG